MASSAALALLGRILLPAGATGLLLGACGGSVNNDPGSVGTGAGGSPTTAGAGGASSAAGGEGGSTSTGAGGSTAGASAAGGTAGTGGQTTAVGGSSATGGATMGGGGSSVVDGSCVVGGGCVAGEFCSATPPQGSFGGPICECASTEPTGGGFQCMVTFPLPASILVCYLPNDSESCLPLDSPSLPGRLKARWQTPCPGLGPIQSGPTAEHGPAGAECCYTAQSQMCVGGRPLLVADSLRSAKLASRSDWA